MAKGKKRDESLPLAVATQGGLLATMAVLLVGMTNGSRGWILLIKAGTAFLLASALLKLLAAGVMQGFAMKADAPKPKKRDLDDDLDDPAAMAESLAPSLETTEKVSS
ncbi:MAG: hypothetical protein DHS20C21_08170 [Gemmatimonadota bacterium]|nr:MAG: hypothetical protein DHS20C21_08170 [Gemmatimonadota bacterium]